MNAWDRQPADTITHLAEISYASRLRETIREYWFSRGYEIRVDLVPLNMGGHDNIHRTYGLRSNLKNGLPPDA